MSRPGPVPFDTHRFVKRMTEAGMPPGQAEALAEEQVAHLDTHLLTKRDAAELAARQDRLATKEDIAALAAAQTNFATRDELAEIKTELAIVKTRVGFMLWLVSSVGGGVVFLIFRSIWPS